MRHFTDDDLARYIEGDLRPRRSAKIGSHLAGCSDCQGRVAALRAVPSLLASVPYPPIPERLSSRIDMALAAESSARVAGQPASEAGRRDLPGRAKPGRQGGAWMPRLTSPLALRTGAAVAAAVVVAGGGYALVSHTGSGSGPTSSSISSPPAVPAYGKVHNGPSVNYRHGGHNDSITSVKSATDFRSATLAKQAALALAAQGSAGSKGAARTSGSSSTFGAPTSAGQPYPNASVSPGAAKLQGCVDRVAAGRSVLLVDVAKYEGSPATIIVVRTSSSGRAEVYAAGSGCSASKSDILATQSLAST
jgi:hypothetical protein